MDDQGFVLMKHSLKLHLILINLEFFLLHRFSGMVCLAQIVQYLVQLLSW